MNTDLKFYYALFLQRLPVMAVIFAVFTALGIALALTLPPRYRAEAILVVEGSKIPVDLRAFEDETEGTEQLQIIEKQLMTRSNLIDIANRHRVFAGEVGMTPDDVVERMRELTEIELVSGRDRATIMTVSFLSGEAKTSADVVNDFVTIVLKADAESRIVGSGDTLEFFDQQVQRYSGDLSRQSAKIVAFKEENKDALPEEQTYRLSQQTALQDRLNLADRDLASLRDQRARLLAVGEASGVPTVNMTPDQQQLSDLENELNAALAIYSETNPKVTILQARIASIKRRMMRSGTTPSTDAEGSPASVASTMLDLQLAEIDSRIDYLEKEKVRTEADMQKLRVAIERTPSVAIGLQALESEYASLQIQMNQAVASRAAARQGVEIESAAKGQRISVLEQASQPSAPNSPNRKLVAGGGVFVGTALAAAFFGLGELLNRTIRRPIDLSRALGVQPLVTIPFLEEETARRRRRILKTIFTIAMLIAVPAALWAVHTFYLPLDLLIEDLMARVGL
jgi:uncharacterized protein involved in exopolysaccharide biosynthesis